MRKVLLMVAVVQLLINFCLTTKFKKWLFDQNWSTDHFFGTLDRLENCANRRKKQRSNQKKERNASFNVNDEDEHEDRHDEEAVV